MTARPPGRATAWARARATYPGAAHGVAGVCVELLLALALTLTMVAPATLRADPPAVGATAGGTRGAGDAARVEVLGLRRSTVTAIREVLGAPPSAPEALEAWAEERVGVVVESLVEAGYPAARAWYVVEGDLVRVEVDEGRISRVVFVGAGSYDAFLLSDNVMLPGFVLYEPALEESLADLAHRYGLRRVPWRVLDGDRFYTTELGSRVTERVLMVRLFEEEGRGWDLDVTADSRWGLVPGVEYERGHPWGPERHVSAWLRVGLPVHEYIFEQDPALRWVFGELAFTYTFGAFGDSVVAPRLHVATRLPLHERRDLDAAGALVSESVADLSFVLRLTGRLEQVFGVGVQVVEVVDVEPLPGVGATRIPDEPFVVRPLLRSWTRWTPNDGTLRLDLRDFVEIDLHAGANLRESLTFGARVESRLVSLFPWGALLLRNRLLYLGGDVRFFDEVPLTGSYLRTGFDDLLWVREALQTEGAARFALSSNFDLGVFADLSVFRDRRADDAPWRLATSFGPSIHALIVDQFSFDVWYGFGFAPSGFDHSIGLHFGHIY